MIVNTYFVVGISVPLQPFVAILSLEVVKITIYVKLCLSAVT